VFQRTIDGVALRFHLAGINNQNFLMRDEQTGTYWQQNTGLAVSGPLAGRRLTLVPADELSFALWKAERPEGRVLNDVPKYARGYSPVDWDVRMAKAPTVISYAQAGLQPRDLMLGIHAFGASRAVPYEALVKEKLIQDHIGGEPILIVLGGDGKSVRVFRQRMADTAEPPQFYRIVGSRSAGQVKEGPPGALLMDAPTGSQWNFQGCAVAGKSKGVCLEQIGVIKDYWFDWRHYNPNTTVYGVKQRIR
jgi:hypothetical protein